MTHPLNPVVEECKRLKKTLLPISEKYHGLSEQFRSKNTLFPFVLLLGNHSSGKSSFINHILKRKVQATGVAPTDDNFTIIGPGDSDIDRNGPALVGDPDLGFEDLKTFGPVLVNHTQLKVRANTAVTDFMIVDSPGMIDSPVTNKSLVDAPVGMDRGYNFEGVCRWYAERADVILLFFDPDKPGTTGETLSILTTALVGLDHKMFIILNKADQFHKIHDFARAYGSLCWNLSKVIPRKDLPRIHTMCLPATAVSMSPSPPSPVPLPSDLDLPQIPTESALIRTPPSASPVLDSLLSLELPQKVISPVPSSLSLATPSSGSGSDKCNTFTPVVTPTSGSNGMQAGTQHKTFFEQGIHDLEESRAEVEMETFNAPRRRVDNEISRLTEIVSSLQMHCTIVDKALEIYHNRLWRARSYILTSLACSIGITIGANYLCDALLPTTWGGAASLLGSGSTSGDSVSGGSVTTGAGNAGASGAGAGTVMTKLPIPSATLKPSTHTAPTFYSEMWNFQSKRTVVGWTALSSVLGTGAVFLWEHMSLLKLLRTFNEKSTFEAIYRRVYHKELTARDEFTAALGKMVLDDLPSNVNAEYIQHAQRVDKGDFSALKRVLHDDIANLRRRASPNFPVLSTPIKLLSPAASYGNLGGVSELAVSPTTEKLLNMQQSLTSSDSAARLRVHFSPSTASSPITTKETQLKKTMAKKKGRAFFTPPAGFNTPTTPPISTTAAASANGFTSHEAVTSSEAGKQRGIAAEVVNVEDMAIPDGHLLGVEDLEALLVQGRFTPSPTASIEAASNQNQSQNQNQHQQSHGGAEEKGSISMNGVANPQVCEVQDDEDSPLAGLQAGKTILTNAEYGANCVQHCSSAYDESSDECKTCGVDKSASTVPCACESHCMSLNTPVEAYMSAISCKQ